jgi:hypothetical protein
MATNISLMNIYHANGTNFDLNLISSLLLPEHDQKIQKSQNFAGIFLQSRGVLWLKYKVSIMIQ